MAPLSPPTTPQQHQQQRRQVLRDLALNFLNESPRRRRPSTRPISPTPSSGLPVTPRTATRTRNRLTREIDLQASPRRRRPLTQDENVPPPVIPQVPIPSIQTSLQCPTPQATQSGVLSGTPNNRSIAQQRRRAREREERRALALTPDPLAPTQPTPRAPQSVVLSAAPSNRSIAQQRRRAREREERQVLALTPDPPEPNQTSTPNSQQPRVASLSRRGLSGTTFVGLGTLQLSSVASGFGLQTPNATQQDGSSAAQLQQQSSRTSSRAHSISQQTRRAREREERQPTSRRLASRAPYTSGSIPSPTATRRRGAPPLLPTTQIHNETEAASGESTNGSDTESDSGSNSSDITFQMPQVPPATQNRGSRPRNIASAPAQRLEDANPARAPSNHRGRRKQDLFLLARKPYQDPPQRHYLGRMDVPCKECGALHWLDERLKDSSQSNPRFSTCCFDGRVQLPPLEDPPLLLQNLLTSDSPAAKEYREENWRYNRAFAFTSLGVREDHTINGHGRGPPVFKICGELAHWTGSLVASGQRKPRYAQLYIFEPRAALEQRMRNTPDLNRRTMQRLQAMLLEHHQYAPIFKHAHEILRDYQGPIKEPQVRLRLAPGLDRRTYNLPTADEVAVILPSDPSKEPRDIILRNRANGLYQISDLHPAYIPLQYPLLFPYGENGWYPEMVLCETEKQREKRIQNAQNRRQRRNQVNPLENNEEDTSPNDRRLTLCRYAAYRIHYRPQEFNTLLRGGRLYTRYLVDIFASIDQNRLRFLADNQAKIRAAHFNGLEDAMVHDGNNLDLNELGQRVILPSSYIGGPRCMTQRFQDAMTIARYFRKVDIFLTMTTNPEWKELLEGLLPGQTAYDRPELVARVFHMKKDALIHMIENGIFGRVAAYVYTIEYQKRGLPHMHLLIFLQDEYKLTTPEAIDSCISAQWPDPETQPLLFETVKKRMVHGPCGALNPNAPCMVDGKCSKGFPKPFQAFTSMDRKGYPLYARPEDGPKYQVGTHMIDCRWLIAYCPFVSAELDCHTNVECAVSIESIKYPFKYVYKGPDRALLEEHRDDEITRYVDGRYISPPEAAWRILQYEMHKQVPSVVRLQVHLENHQMVAFNPHEDIEAVLERGARQRTTLTAFFEANGDNGTLGQAARNYTYQEFPQHFTWDSNAKQWHLRKNKKFSLGRMFFVKPTAGEQFYLRTLLTVVRGPKSFEDLRRVPGHVEPLPTYHAACVARGLLEDDGEWRLCLEEAAQIRTGTQLRQLFATILLFSDVSQPDVLWNSLRHHLCDDLHWQLTARGLTDPSEDDVYDFGLYLLDMILRESGHTLQNWPSMPLPQSNWSELVENPLIAEQLNYNHGILTARLDEALPRLNTEQRQAYITITTAVEDQTGELFFLSGPGGTGKTFVYNTVCAKLRSQGFIVLCVSSSGISALLLQGGRTAHSMFKIPVELIHEDSVCNIPKESTRADLLRRTRAIIWDEIGAQHKHAVEALDRTLRDLRNEDRPFGGITVVLGGDFMQTLPVVPRASRTEIIDATIQRSYLWEHVKILTLHENMRLQGASEETREYAQWLLDVGHGRNHVDDCKVQFPDSMRSHSVESLIETIYPGIDSPSTPPPEYFLNRMILAPRNADVQDINNVILDQMTGETYQYISADELIHEAGADPQNSHIPVEYLRSINTASLPPGELNLKIGCPVILLRNLAPSQGLCNGTRMVIAHAGSRVLEVLLIGGEKHGERALIPRISLTPTSTGDIAFKFKRRQFPVRLAFAMSINKAQGQSVTHVGLHLQMPVFAHGQLYVALSRVTSPDNIKIYISEDPSVESITSNVVYNEILID